MTVCGDGGMVTTNDEEIAEKIKLLRNHGQHPKDVHTILGYTARLNTVNAAIGRVQLKHVPKWVEERREIAKKYRELLNDIDEIMLIRTICLLLCAPPFLQKKYFNSTRYHITPSTSPILTTLAH